MKKILIVEDELPIAELEKDYFFYKRYQTKFHFDKQSQAHLFGSTKYLQPRVMYLSF